MHNNINNDNRRIETKHKRRNKMKYRTTKRLYDFDTYIRITGGVQGEDMNDAFNNFNQVLQSQLKPYADLYVNDAEVHFTEIITDDCIQDFVDDE